MSLAVLFNDNVDYELTGAVLNCEDLEWSLVSQHLFWLKTWKWVSKR